MLTGGRTAREPRRATCGACGSEQEVGSEMRRREEFQFRARPAEATDSFYCRCQDEEW